MKKYLPFVCFGVAALLGGCGLLEIFTSEEGKSRAVEGGMDIIGSPTMGTVVKEVSDYLIWGLAAWVMGDKGMQMRKKRKELAEKSTLEERLALVENKLTPTEG